MGLKTKQNRQWGWAMLLIAGIFIIAAISGYTQFDELERNGGSIQTTRRVASFYKTFGKAGFPVIFGTGSLICFVAGCWVLAKNRHGRFAQASQTQCPRCDRTLERDAFFCKHCKTLM